MLLCHFRLFKFILYKYGRITLFLYFLSWNLKMNLNTLLRLLILKFLTDGQIYWHEQWFITNKNMGLNIHLYSKDTWTDSAAEL